MKENLKEISKKMRLVCGYDILTDSMLYRADISLATTKNGVATFDTQYCTQFRCWTNHKFLRRKQKKLIAFLWRHAKLKRPVAVRKGLIKQLPTEGIPKENLWSL